VLRAAQRLAQAAGCPPAAHLHLTKNLPLASGIGGGSADAAAALRLLQRFWGVQLPQAQLHQLAASLGADVPVCLASIPARMAGIGEVLTSAPSLPPCGLVLVNPGVAVPTPAVFKARCGDFTPAPVLPSGFATLDELVAFLADVTNDLEAPALSLAPVIGELLAVLRGFAPITRLARMSGSGATCFALTATAAEAQQLANLVHAQRPDWFVWGGGLFCANPALR